VTAREPTLATLKALAAADDGWYGSTDGEPPPGVDEASQAHFRALKAYRIERGTQRRTEAEVDAQIAGFVRGWADAGCGLMLGPERVALLQALCNERTADSGPAGAAAKESREDIAAPEGAPIEFAREPGVYHWKRVPLELWGNLGHELTHPDRYSVLRIELIQAIQAVLAAAHGAPAAPEEAQPHPDDRPCGCEDTDNLRQLLRQAEGRLRQVVEINRANERAYLEKTDALERRNFELVNHLKRIRTLALTSDVVALLDQLQQIQPEP
jgi:hypothetical protein